MTRYILLTVGVTLVVVLGLLIDVQSRTPANRPASQSRQEMICALGRVEGATPEIELRPRLAGRVEELLVEEGQFVEQGEVLLRLGDEQYRHEVALAAAGLELAEAELDRLLNGAHPRQRAEAAALCRAKQAELEGAQLSWKRINELNEARAISRQEADNQRALVTSLVAEVEAARARLQRLQAAARPDEVRISKAHIKAAGARLELANVQLDRTKLHAPGRGRILKVDVEPGELTGPESAEPAIVMADTSSFRVRAFVEEMDAPRVKVGMTARIVADGLPGQELKGRVTRLSPRMSRKKLWSDHPAERYDTKTREVWIELEEAEGLVVGLRVDVMIDLESRASAHTGVVKPKEAKPTGQSPPELPPTAPSVSVEQ